MNSRVGVVGAGRMGQAMARRLLAQGFSVVVYNRSAGRLDDLQRMGATIAATPRQLASQVDIVISSLTGEEALLAVCTGADGLLEGGTGVQHLSMSTLSPDAAQRMLVLHAQCGQHYLSCPVQGRPAMAEAGQLVAWVSGAGFEGGVQSVLSVLARKTIVLGSDVEQAAAAKLALNLLMNANIELFAEAFSYVGQRGVDMRVFGEGLTESAFAAPLFKAIVSGLLSGDDTARGSDVSVSAKDLDLLVKDMANDRLPVTTALHEVFSDAERRGWGDLDPIAVRRLFARPARDPLQ